MAKPTYLGRILLAILLMISFYTLAVLFAATLIMIPVAELVFVRRLHLQIAIPAVIGGIMILISVFPRWDRFIPPGPKLTESDQPELFRHLQGIAQATEQAMPSEVYALPEMNAWVTNRGGFMGLGSRRVMGIGVPLMQVLSTEQFRGVLAHEFGHYYGGDTKLGPWFFVTRSAIIRTVMNLADSGSNILRKPFEWYLRLFLWLTERVSRQQEFTADEIAAKTVGPNAIGEALKVIHSQGLAFQVYWEQEFGAVLNQGYHPPMASGFREFLDAPNVQDSIAKALDHALSHSEGSIYDSHPPLKDRLEAVAKVEGPKSPSHDPPAINWLKNVDQLENQMILHLFKTAGVSSPKTVSWSDVGNQVFVPFWSKYLNDISGNLKGITLWQASEMLESDEFRRKLLNPEIVRHAPEEAQKQLAISIVGLGAIVALSREGWSIQSLPGRPPYATKGEEKIEPAAWIEGFLEKKHTLEELQDYFEACGIDDVEIESLKDKGTQAAKA